MSQLEGLRLVRDFIVVPLLGFAVLSLVALLVSVAVVALLRHWLRVDSGPTITSTRDFRRDSYLWQLEVPGLWWATSRWPRIALSLWLLRLVWDRKREEFVANPLRKDA